jgi:putative sugar O-methyltransferase
MKNIFAYFVFIIYSLITGLLKIFPGPLRRISYSLKEAVDSVDTSAQKDSLGFKGPAITSVETKPINETELVQLVVSSYRAAKETQLHAPKAYQPSGVWSDDVLRVRLRDFDDAISRGDLVTVAGFLRSFFRNEGIAGLWDNQNVFERFCRLDKMSQLIRSNTMIKHYSVWRESLPFTPIKELDAPRVGNPWGYYFDGMLLYEPVFEYNFEAHYFDQLLHCVQNPVVLEIGGGFGGLAHHFLQCSPHIKYIGVDLPENILIQTYYLASIFPDARVLTYSKDFSLLDRSLLDHYDIVLLPNFELPNVASRMVDLIINVRSLSEMAYDTISEYHDQIDRIGRLFFFHENICNPEIGSVGRVSMDKFPDLKNYTLITSSESRWPKWQKKSLFHCQENLFLHRNALQTIR